jgi:hypothetical protein
MHRYADDKAADLRRAGREVVIRDVRVLTTSPLSEEPVGKVVLFRSEEQRTETHYILRHGRTKWLINYLLRDPDTAEWQAAFAEMDGALPAFVPSMR